MKRLGRERFQCARTYLLSQARPVDRALYEHRFEGAPAGAVLAQLSRFQNDDGGFGRGLEPDVRTPSSSALATGIGLQLLKELGCTANHPMVRMALQYLLESFDAGTMVWPVIPADANDYPHAPWWHDDEGSLSHTFDGFRVIPRAQLAGLLHHFSAHIPERWLHILTERTVSDIESTEPLGSGGGSDVVYALSLAQTATLPHMYQKRLAVRLRRAIPAFVSRDPADWSSYCCPPIKLAPLPESLAADLLKDDIQTNLDYLIEHQAADGAWDPTWSWAGLFPEDWQVARREWRGHLTVETLTSLRAYGRLEEWRHE